MITREGNCSPTTWLLKNSVNCNRTFSYYFEVINDLRTPLRRVFVIDRRDVINAIPLSPMLRRPRITNSLRTDHSSGGGISQLRNNPYCSNEYSLLEKHLFLIPTSLTEAAKNKNHQVYTTQDKEVAEMKPIYLILYIIFEFEFTFVYTFTLDWEAFN